MPTEAQENEQAEKYWTGQERSANKAAERNGIVEIWRDDSRALAGLINAICTDVNRRVWWEITDRWLKTHSERLIPYGPADDIRALQEVIQYQEILKQTGRPMTITGRDLAEAKNHLAVLKSQSGAK
jgi:hypothetical protein